MENSHLKVHGSRIEGNRVHPGEVMGDGLVLFPFLAGEGRGLGTGCNPVEEDFVITGFGTQDKAKIGTLQLSDGRGMGRETVSQDHSLEMGMILTEGCDQAFHGLAFTVI